MELNGLYINNYRYSAMMSPYFFHGGDATTDSRTFYEGYNRSPFRSTCDRLVCDTRQQLSGVQESELRQLE